MLEAELSNTAILPFGSVLFLLVQCSILQTKRRLILRWNECKVIPGCWVMKRICEVHYKGLGLGMGKPEGEEGIVPTSQRACRGRSRSRRDPSFLTIFSLLKLKAMFALACARRFNGLSSQQHWQPATVFCSCMPVTSMDPTQSCNYGLRCHRTTSPRDIYGSDTYNL